MTIVKKTATTLKVGSLPLTQTVSISRLRNPDSGLLSWTCTATYGPVQKAAMPALHAQVFSRAMRLLAKMEPVSVYYGSKTKRLAYIVSVTPRAEFVEGYRVIVRLRGVGPFTCR